MGPQLTPVARLARLVAIGGFDPGGGAGVIRDYLTARALGAAVRLVPTAWTEQGPAGVTAVEPREREGLGRAIAAALRGGGSPAGPEGQVAVKIGMLPDRDRAEAVLATLGGFPGPVVLDPVLAASSGGVLFRGEPAALLPLCARATLVTPNAVEASALAGMPVANAADAGAAGRALLARGARAVLVKGGHLDDELAVDTLVTADGTRELAAARLPGPPVRGTGCALATAIAVGLGRGLTLDDAVAAAKRWLHAALAAAVDVDGERRLS